MRVWWGCGNDVRDILVDTQIDGKAMENTSRVYKGR